MLTNTPCHGIGMTQGLPALIRHRGEGRTLPLPTGRVTFTATTADTGGRFELYELDLDPDQRPLRRHVHQQMEEMIIVVDGELDAVVGERQMRLHAGSTLFIPRGLPHAWANRGRSSATVLLHYTPSGQREQYFERMARLLGGSLPPTQAQLDDLARRFDEQPIDDE